MPIVEEISQGGTIEEGNNLVICERCDDEVEEHTAHYIDSRFGYNDVYLCESCYESELDMEEVDEDEEENEEYPINDDTGDCPDLTDDEVLNSIQKDNTFGLEFEMFGGVQNSGIKNFLAGLGYSYSGDGSIEGNNAIEVQTSVLKGKKGANTVLEFLKFANKSEFKVNDSCGTHVHLGALDFFDNFKFKLSTFATSEKEERIVIERGLLTKISEVLGNEQGVNDWISDMYMRSQNREGYSTTYRMQNGLVSRYSSTKLNVMIEENGYFSKYPLICRDSTVEKLGTSIEELSTGQHMLVVGSNINRNNYFSIKPEDLCVYSRPRSEKYEMLRSLFYTYLVFEKLLFAMLPENRKDNTYCNPLSTSYTHKDVANCNSQEDIEKLWYKKLSLRDVARAKTEHYEGSRYHAINFHSLFYRYGTMEVRTHHGTLQAHSILMWVALHQAIMKGVLNGKFYFLWGMNLRRDMRTVQDQYKMLISRLALKDTPLEKFITYRLNKYSPLSLKEIKK